MLRSLCLGVLAFVVMLGLPSAARATSVTLTPSVASPQKLGTPVGWTATVQSPVSGHTYDYQFSFTFNGQKQIVRDFNVLNEFTWVRHWRSKVPTNPAIVLTSLRRRSQSLRLCPLTLL